jgi:hypothetical protein
MVMTRVKPRGSFYAYKHARTHARVSVNIRDGIPVEDGFRLVAVSSQLCEKPFPTCGELNLTIYHHLKLMNHSMITLITVHYLHLAHGGTIDTM